MPTDTPAPASTSFETNSDHPNKIPTTTNPSVVQTAGAAPRRNDTRTAVMACGANAGDGETRVLTNWAKTLH